MTNSDIVMRDALAALDEAVMVTDAATVIVFVNPAMERISGYREDELVGMKPSVLRGPTASNEFFQKMWANLNAGKSWRSDFENHHKSGNTYLIDQTISPILDGQGDITGFVSVQRDVTRERHARQQARDNEIRREAILESALDCIITIDQDGMILEFNPAAERTFSYSKADVLGKQLAETIIPPEMRASHFKGLAHYLETGEGPVLFQRIELPPVKRTGKRTPLGFLIPCPLSQPEI